MHFGPQYSMANFKASLPGDTAIIVTLRPTFNIANSNQALQIREDEQDSAIKQLYDADFPTPTQA